MNISRNILTALGVLALSTCAWAQYETPEPQTDPNSAVVPVEQPSGTGTAPGLQGGAGQSAPGFKPVAQPASTFDDPRGRDRRGRGRSFWATDLRDAPNDPIETADRALADRVRQALAADAALNIVSKNVRVSANNGQITLKGKVASEEAKTSVGTAATGIAGAGKVTNKLKIRSGRKLMRKDDTKNDDEGVLR